MAPCTLLIQEISTAERNYEIFDKGLLAITRIFEEYRSELMSADVDKPVQVLCDHKNMKYLMTTEHLNAR